VGLRKKAVAFGWGNPVSSPTRLSIFSRPSAAREERVSTAPA